MVTSQNFERLRTLNFGAGVLVNPLRAEYLEPEIAYYDPEDAARVTQRVREEAGLEAACQRWINLYTAIIEEARQSPPDREAEMRATAAYLRKWNYAKGIEPTRNIMKRIRQIPIIGNDIAHFSRKLLRNMSKE